MSDSIIFDTNLHIKRITKTGVSHESAEAFVETVAHVLEHNLATKSDIAGVHHAIELLRKDTQIAITKLENKLIRWIVSMTVGMTLTTILAFVGIAVVFIK